jgi:cobyrinic acid a,c-diamide synthase
VLGALPRRETLALPERHLGLVLPGEVEGFGEVVREAANAVAEYLDLDLLQALAAGIAAAPPPPALPALGQHIAVARDDAFAFLYEHLLAGWREQGADLSFFSPLADEAPAAHADAIYLPGGYPELHAGRLAAAENFRAGLIAARDRGALIYGECGGYMVLGETLVDKGGVTHEMANLLPITTRIDRPHRTLGYRHLRHAGPLPWPAELRGHEFHYSSGSRPNLPPLFTATDASGRALEPLGVVLGKVMGS